MNRNSPLYESIVLALVATVLTGKAVLAEDLPQDEAMPEKSNIVLATATTSTPHNDARTKTSDTSQDDALKEALEGILADSKLELEMRLSGHKSLNLTPDP